MSFRLFIGGVIIHLDRYKELENFSDAFIKQLKEGQNDLKALALRNMAVAKREDGDLEGAQKIYKEAFEIAPNDENILKPYLNVLKELKQDDAYLEIAKRLINLDPTDVSYYVIYIKALIEKQRYSEAEQWIKKAMSDSVSKDRRYEYMLRNLSDEIRAGQALETGE